MGNDGGSIPKRRELVKEAARNPTTTELKETQREQQAHRWSTCPISHKPLCRPIVSDWAGYLYNKDAVLQYLLPVEAILINKEDCDNFLQGRVKSLKDVVEVLLEPEKGEAGKDERWICPVTSKVLGPTIKAVYLVPCGHAFSQEAVKEMKSDQCLQCNQAYEPQNIVIILPTAEHEKEQLKARVERLSNQGLTHSLKKASGSGKKRKANGVVKAEKTNADGGKTGEHGTNVPEPLPAIPRSSTPQSGVSTPKVANGIKNAATASLTAKVLEEEEARKKRRVLMGENEHLKSLFSKSDGGKKYKDADFMTRGFSIPAKARHQ